MEAFTEHIKVKNTKEITVNNLEEITHKYPYFHLAKSILLKKYHSNEHFKYNTTLKNVAAHTNDRAVLFDYINTIEEEKATETSEDKLLKTSKQSEKTTVQSTDFNNTVTNKDLEIKKNTVTQKLDKTHISLAQEKPFNFNQSEKHSFNQWLQLTTVTPIERKKKPTKITDRQGIIDQFIKNNPKISPVKKDTPNITSIKNRSNQISQELMTETLAKVYFAQKKYEKAIKAYKILSLKYPEKSGLFADQINRIKIIQTHK